MSNEQPTNIHLALVELESIRADQEDQTDQRVIKAMQILRGDPNVIAAAQMQQAVKSPSVIQAMQITQEHYDQLASALDQAIILITEYNRMPIQTIAHQYYRDRNHSPKLFRQRMSQLGVEPVRDLRVTLHTHLTDDQLDSAMRHYWSSRVPWAAQP